MIISQRAIRTIGVLMGERIGKGHNCGKRGRKKTRKRGEAAD
jgi:hypothetical protein